jgi:hypothetical protein
MMLLLLLLLPGLLLLYASLLSRALADRPDMHACAWSLVMVFAWSFVIHHVTDVVVLFYGRWFMVGSRVKHVCSVNDLLNIHLLFLIIVHFWLAFLKEEEVL